jgi:hypothetical protein
MGAGRRLDFLVRKDDLRTCKFVEAATPSVDELPADCALLKVDRFAFTTNNVSYAMLGDQLGYWKLFPAPDGFGIIPAWGFGEVLASRSDVLSEGERLFGYFPMSTHLVVAPTSVGKRTVADAAPHRQSVSPVYNQYSRVTNDPSFVGRSGDQQALLRPLFMLSFLVDDFLADTHFFGASAVLLSSASSKTAIGLAHLLHENRKPVATIGLTSARNHGFVSKLGCYDRVISYDDVASLDPGLPVAFVDLAGNAVLRRALHVHFGDSMKYSMRVGFTHRGEESEDDLPGARPIFFFAPDQIGKRAQDWGRGGLETRFAAVWPGYCELFDRWFEIDYGSGTDAVERVYRESLEGRVKPDRADILSLWDLH